MCKKVYHVTASKFASPATETLGIISIPEDKVAEAQELVKALIREETDNPDLFLDMAILLGQGVYVYDVERTMRYNVSIHKVLEP